jgi:hypothetical protein
MAARTRSRNHRHFLTMKSRSGSRGAHISWCVWCCRKRAHASITGNPQEKMRMSTKTKPSPCWRDTLPIHPAAELFPRMSPDELQALGDDVVVKNGSRATAK